MLHTTRSMSFGLVALACISVLSPAAAQDPIQSKEAQQPATRSGTITVKPAANTTKAEPRDETSEKLDSLFGNHVVFNDFLHLLKEAVKENDKRRVARLVRYPVRIHVGGKIWKIDNADHFIVEYNAIITDRVKKALTASDPVKFLNNSPRAYIGDGELVFSPIGDAKRPKITNINS